MKVKVIERFVDKNTKEFYKIDQILEITKDRYEEVKKYVEPIVENKNDRNRNNEG